MFDFPFTEASVWTSLYFVCFWLVIFCQNYPKGLYARNTEKTNHRGMLFLIAFFLITHSMRGDFFHLMEDVHEYDFSPNAYNYGEPVYIAIAKIVNRNYFLFRTVVWGGAFGLFCWTAKRMNVPVYSAAIFLILTHSVTFAYARVTAAMAVYFFGLSFLCNSVHRHKISSYLVGLLLIGLSTRFHTSAYIMVVSTLMLFVPLRKWTILAGVVCIPFCISLALNLLGEILFSGMDETIARKIQVYATNNTHDEYGIAAKIIDVIGYASFYVPLIVSAICIFSKRNEGKIPSGIVRMFKVTFGLVLVSAVCGLMGEFFYVYFYRVLFMTMIPLSIITVKLYQGGGMSVKHFRYTCYAGLIFIGLRSLYDIYISILT